jgi:hypothetical protein
MDFNNHSHSKSCGWLCGTADAMIKKSINKHRQIKVMQFSIPQTNVTIVKMNKAFHINGKVIDHHATASNAGWVGHTEGTSIITDVT